MARVNKGVLVTQEITVESEPPQPVGPPTKWQENHGNFLMIFVVIVFIAGGCLLVYRQNRFVPPRFPEAKSIDTPPRRVAEVNTAENVTISVMGAANDFGRVKIAVYDSASTFNRPEEAIISETVAIADGEAVWTIPLKLPKKIAVAAFHDENSDEQLNRNRFGIPTERYGFSVNSSGGAVGPPSFDQSVIETPATSEAINIVIR